MVNAVVDVLHLNILQE